MEAINEAFIKLFALFLGTIGSFTLVSWCKFQIELFFVAIEYRREQIKFGLEPKSILSAFGHIKATYNGSQRTIVFKFAKEEENNDN